VKTASCGGPRLIGSSYDGIISKKKLHYLLRLEDFGQRIYSFGKYRTAVSEPGGGDQISGNSEHNSPLSKA